MSDEFWKVPASKKWMVRRIDMLTPKEKAGLEQAPGSDHEVDPENPIPMSPEEIAEYNAQIYEKGVEYEIGFDGFSEAIMQDEVAESDMPAYRAAREAIEEKDRYKFNGMKTGKFFETKRKLYGWAFNKGARPRECYLYWVWEYDWQENQENIEGGLGMRIYSNKIKPIDLYLDSNPEHVTEDSTSYPGVVMKMIREEDPASLDWNMLCMTEDFSEEFMEEFSDYMKWDKISKYQLMSPAFMQKHIAELDSRNFTEYQNLSESFMEENSEFIYWPSVPTAQKDASLGFIASHVGEGKQTTWEEVLDTKTPSEDDLRRLATIIDWSLVCENVSMSIEFMEEMIDYLVWDKVVENQELTSEFLDAHDAQLDWNLVSKYQTCMTDQQMKNHKNEIDWATACRTQTMSEELMSTYPSRIDWNTASQYQKMSLPFIQRFKDKVNWTNIIQYQSGITMAFIEEHKYYADWSAVSRFVTLSESYIDSHKEKLDWTAICSCQKLSEQFIKDHLDKIDWNGVSEFQNISEEFVEEFKDYVNWSLLSKHPGLSEAYIDRYCSRWDWRAISQYQVLSEPFIEAHENDVDWDAIFRYQTLSDEFKQKWKWKVR